MSTSYSGYCHNESIFKGITAAFHLRNHLFKFTHHVYIHMFQPVETISKQFLSHKDSSMYHTNFKYEYNVICISAMYKEENVSTVVQYYKYGFINILHNIFIFYMNNIITLHTSDSNIFFFF